jgi:hypothetical protein
MDSKQTDKAPIVASKSFMAVGPSLHYSHENVRRCWLLAFAAFCLSCFFWSKIVSGRFWSFDPEALTSPDFWLLGQSLVTGVSIFEYPWQILVLGLLMGIIAIVPVLISQLMSFGHSLIFILAVFFFANLPGFSACLLVSCLAVACRPLRFRSRFIAIALCMAPQLVYWGFLGGARGDDPIGWGFSFAPWICAWLDGLAIAGIVLAIGHFTRYKPGLVWIFTSIAVLTAVILFEVRIGFDELDYQLYVAKNNPEEMSEFHEHPIGEALDNTLADDEIMKYLNGFFYPKEPILLRAELLKEIQIMLGYDRWPSWLIVPPELDYQTKRESLLRQYNLFISRRPNSRRMPIALYYKALLSEYSPDLRPLGEKLPEKQVLRFYSDYPHRGSLVTWHRIYERFPEKPESLEARWRIAMDWAGQRKFEQADKLLAQAEDMLAKQLKAVEAKQAQHQSDSLWAMFRPPADSVITKFKLINLQRRSNLLRTLIGAENRTQDPNSSERLARFVMLNPYSLDYEQHLDALFAQIKEDDPLRDNIRLAKAKLVADENRRAEELGQLHKEFQEADGGMLALYELGLLKKRRLSQTEDASPEQKKRLLTETRATLGDFLRLYPNSFCTEQVRQTLDGLPAAE